MTTRDEKEKMKKKQMKTKMKMKMEAARRGNRNQGEKLIDIFTKWITYSLIAVGFIDKLYKRYPTFKITYSIKKYH